MGDILAKVAYSKISNFNKFNGKKILCMGDSITGDYDYPVHLSKILGATVYNCGFGGAKWIGGSANYTNFSAYALATAMSTGTWTDQDASVAILTDYAINYAILKSLDFATIDYLVIMIGTNDHDSTAIGYNTDTGASGTIKGAVNSFISLLLTAFPNLKIHIATPFFRSRNAIGDNVDSDNYPGQNGRYLIDYADAIVEMANLHRIPSFDMYRNSGINTYTATTYLVDGLHPTSGVGDILIAQKIAGFLNSGFAQENKSEYTRQKEFQQTLRNMNRYRIVDFDDFLYNTYTEANTPWIQANGSNATAGITTANTAFGALTFVTGGVDGVYANDGVQIASKNYAVPQTNGDLICETHLRLSTAITGASINFGLTDTKNLEEPFSIGANDAVISTATNAVCFTYDADADTKCWHALSVNTDVDNYQNGKCGEIDIFNCQTAFDEQVIANVVADTDTDDAYTNSSRVSSRFTVGEDFTTGIIGTKAITRPLGSTLGIDVSIQTHISFWFKSSVNLDSGDYKLLLDNTALCASPLNSLTIPAITADTWTFVKIALSSPANLTSLISVGLQQMVDKGACVIHIDDIRTYHSTRHALVAGSYQSLRLVLSDDGTTAKFYIRTAIANEWQLVKTLTNVCVAPASVLYMTLNMNSTGATAKTFIVDYLEFSIDRA